MADHDIKLAQAMSAVALADASYDGGQYAHATAPPLEAEPEISVHVTASKAEAAPIVVADSGGEFTNTSSKPTAFENFVADGAAGRLGSREGQALSGQYSGEHGSHGRDATPPTRGVDAGTIVIFVEPAQQQVGKMEVRGEIYESANTSSHPQKATYFAPAMTDFNLSAKGGRGGRGGIGGSGGHGARGRRGADATRYRSGENGGPGGDGGNAGRGTDGADGGKGGNVIIRIQDQDSYYLMAFPQVSRSSFESVVLGGKGGAMGSHGQAGSPGKGGSGGSSYSWTTGSGENRTSHYNPGGWNGRSGRPGRSIQQHQPLVSGRSGDIGSVQIIVDGVQKYSCRFDLQLAGLAMQSLHRLHKQDFVFQFSDVVTVSELMVQNTGGMISPIQGTDVYLDQRRIDLYGRHVDSSPEKAWFTERIEPECVGSVDGSLSFQIQHLNIRNLENQYEMEPIVVNRPLYLAATQRGAYGFRRDYPLFNEDGISIQLRNPVESTKRIDGLRSIRAGRGTAVSFAISNTGLRDIGSNTADGRRLVVQFYQNSEAEFDILPEHIDLTIEGVECNSKMTQRSDDVFRGTVFEVDCLRAGEHRSFTGILRFSPQVSPYARTAIQAEILLEPLRHHNTEATTEPCMIPIQGRQLRVSSEPTYVPSDQNQVVIVSCAATDRATFEAWANLVTSRLGLKAEYYSVSIYGSLDPNYQIPELGISLKEAFEGKLLIVLDDTFSPLAGSIAKMEPSRMLPNGPQFQTSGFNQSTRWLLVGSTDAAINQALNSHYTAAPNDVRIFDSSSDYQRFLKDELKKEQSQGSTESIIRESIVKIKMKSKSPNSTYISFRLRWQKKAETTAKSVQSFLEKNDPLRQYVVEVQSYPSGKEYGSMRIRRGYNRTFNSTIVLKDPTKTPSLDDLGAALAILKALPLKTLHLVFASAILTDDALLVDAAIDVYTQHLIWEVSNVLDGRLKGIKALDDVSLAFPSLHEVTYNSTLSQAANSNRDFRVQSLSKLVAHLDCVANSRDLRFHLPGSLRYIVRKTLLAMMKTLKSEWADRISNKEVDSEADALKKKVLGHLKETHGAFGRTRTADRFRKGMLHVCSARNKEKYAQPGYSGYAPRLCAMETDEYKKKSRAIAPCKNIVNEKEGEAMREAVRNQKAMADDLLLLIQSARDHFGVDNEREVAINV